MNGSSSAPESGNGTLWTKGVATSDLAIEAANKALKERGIPATEIEAIFLGTVTPDMIFPATACIVQDKIGAKGRLGL